MAPATNDVLSSTSVDHDGGAHALPGAPESNGPSAQSAPAGAGATVVTWRMNLAGPTLQAPPALGLPGAVPATPTDLDAVRRRKARLRNLLARRVDSDMKLLNRTVVSDVPRLYFEVCGSLVAAVALRQIEAQSEHAFREFGSPWVCSSNAEWMFVCSLNEPEWIGARETLRSIGLVQERRRYESDRQRIVVDLAFEPQAFQEHIDMVRQRIRDRCRSEQAPA